MEDLQSLEALFFKDDLQVCFPKQHKIKLTQNGFLLKKQSKESN